MITLRRAAERHHDKSRTLETWLTFHPRGSDGTCKAMAWRNLEILNENRLAPGARISRVSGHDAEILTYVHEGALAYENSLGSSASCKPANFSA
jgi:redox-sensitive bicupin YhaK (pirin superfamily)